MDIFPVNYTVDGESIVFRTAEGSKLTEVTINDEVLFEVDEYTATDAWSVVVRGTRPARDRRRGRRRGRCPRPWIPT
jgi:nitroimidazol reductase NimA-like FMN-containing flavoprotein (pyridoxamine 5'-phosphate oxidase superfamily)